MFEIEALQCLSLERGLTQDLTALHPQLNHYEVQCLMYWVFQKIVRIFMEGVDMSLAGSGRKTLQREKIWIFVYPIYNHNWKNISTIYICNKTRIKINILTIKQNTSESRSG